MKEYKVGEEFELDMVKFVVVDDNGDDFPCSVCHILHGSDSCEKMVCESCFRIDKKNVHFEKVNL